MTNRLLENKVAVVTGGTRGIGFAIVKKFLENGAKVAILGSKQETVQKAIEEIKKINSEYQVLGYWPDLNNEEEVKNTFNDIYENWQQFDILVNNAGINALDKIYDYKVENFKKIVDLNLNSVFICSKEAAKIMKENSGGSIINASSVVSLYGQPSGVGYPATKFAVNGLTKSLARELGKDNIRVNAVAPGVVKTDMVKNLSEEIIAPIINNIPLKRMAEPEEIANVYLFLASDMASYVSGNILSVDGAVVI